MKKNRPTSRIKYQAMKTILFCLFISCTTSIFAQFSEPFFITHNVQPGSFDLADFDGDGDQDVIMGAGSTEHVRTLVWYENTDGIGNIWIPHEIEQSASVNQIRTLDVDADGDMDFVSGSLSGQSLHLFRNDGNSSNLSFTKELIEDYFSNSFFELVDINNDNILEIITGQGINIKQYNNVDGLGSFEETILVEDFEFYNRQIQDAQIVDLDADGDKDIVISRSKNGVDDETQIGWYRNDQNSFSDFIVLEYNITNLFGCNPTCDINTQLVVANFTNDNLPDIIYLDDGNPQIISQLPDHSFYPPNQIVDLIHPGDLLAIDMDDDGDMDFVSGNQNWNYFTRTWYRNVDGFGIFEEVVLDTLEETYGYNFIRTADVEGDGDQDLFFFSKNGNARGIDGIYMIRNEGGGNYANHTFITDNINGFHTTIPFDIDNDDDIDILIFAEDEGNIYWSENENVGSSFSIPQLLIENENIQDVSIGDLDQDGDLDIFIRNENYELYWYEMLDTTPTFSDKKFIASNILYPPKLVDYNSDGWLDIVIKNYSAHVLYIQNLGGGNFSSINTIDFQFSGSLLSITDIDNNGFYDFIYKENTGGQINLHLAIQDSNGSFSEIILNNSNIGDFNQIFTTDLDNDGDLDIITRVDQVLTSFVYAYFNQGNSFTSHKLIDNVYNRGINITDLNNDGKKDIYSGKEFYLQLYTPTQFSSKINIHNTFIGHYTRPNHADLDNDGDMDMIHGNWSDALAYKFNQINEGYWIEGKVFFDDDENCEYNIGTDTSLYQWLVEIKKGDDKFVASTNPQGYYNAFVPDTGEYIINVIRPSAYWGSCVQDSTILVQDSLSVTLLDIPVQAIVDCPLLGVHVGVGFLRPCIDGYFNVGYTNFGTIPATDAQLEIVPDKWLNINSASVPWSSTTDTSYIFDVGNVSVGESGSIYFNVTPDCDSVSVGDIICVNAFITPDSICVDSLWDGSTIEALGTCVGDSIHFQLENTGSGPMSTDRQLRIQIVNDDIVVLIFVDTFLLNPGEVKNISLAAQGEVLLIEADQDPNHPVANTASLLVTGCSILPPSEVNHLINNFPNEDGDPFSEMFCREVTGSYDPNEKAAVPKGVSDENLIDKTWELDYTIHFQNTGNDTAFTVIIKDPITEHLDLSTLKIRGGNHPFSWELKSNRELIFVFENILLPDSTTNEVESHGYVQFSIKPNESIQPNTEILNFAAIFFDANEPIITDMVNHKIRPPFSPTSTHHYSTVCQGTTWDSIVLMTDTILMSNNNNDFQFNHFEIIDTSITIFEVAVNSGDVFMGVPILQDTIFEEYYLENNCWNLNITNVSIITNSEELESTIFKIYPNPTHDAFFISWKNTSSPTSIKIFDTNGILFKKIDTTNFSSSFSSKKIMGRDWRTGIYILKIETSDKSYFKKLVIID